MSESTNTPNPPTPYATWVDLLLNREPVLAREWERVENGISPGKQFELARSELAALRAENERLRGDHMAHFCRSDHAPLRHNESTEPEELACPACLALNERDSLRAQLAKCQEILRRCFTVVDIKDEGESVMSHDCPTVEEFRSALEAKP